MSNPPAAPATNPVDTAREAFRRLATHRIAPTPDAYRAIYDEIAGVVKTPVPSGPGAEDVLAALAARLCDTPGELAEYGRRLNHTVKQRDWGNSVRLLSQLIEKHLRRGIPQAVSYGAENKDTQLLRELLSRTLSFALPPLLPASPALLDEAESLGAAVKTAFDDNALQEVAARLKELCFQIELHRGDGAEQQEMLLRLFKLLLENVSELLDDDSWMHGQIASIQELIQGPIELRALEDARRSLKDVIFKQGQLRHNLTDMKATVKNMMMGFIEKLGLAAAASGNFHDKLGGYSEQIRDATNITELNGLLDDVLRDTRAVQSEALAARDGMLNAHREVQEAEARVKELEAKLQLMSEMVREDQLTGALNRRGLDDVYERESARADRRGTPLCVAMLDLDNFKRLNDTYGHLAGDNALRHLAKVVKATLRAIDVLARFGGEEFMIILPETDLEAAVQTMVRLQRELTRHFFLHDNEKLLITFSAGVALRLPNEAQTDLLARVDRAMYQAKQDGKNRVVIAA